MRKKYKLTGFARLVIFLILFTPVAYIGANYYNGEDGIAKIKSLFEQNEGRTIQAQIDSKNLEIDALNKQIESLKREVERLETIK
jgi:peptidoglycan hydrolase CwlO-like protein